MTEALGQPAGQPLTVAVIVPARNERDRLPRLIADIEHQRLRPSEVVIADGCSTDGTRAWLDDVVRTRPWLRVVDNPDRVIPAALNRAVSATSADVVARMDTHVTYGPDYLERLVATLASRPDLAGVGGVLRTVGTGAWGRAIAAVFRRPWGLGGAPHRVGRRAGPVDHLSCTAYRGRAVRSVGGWDRQLFAAEDVELDHRVSTRIGELWLVPEAVSTWHVREDPRALLRQMWRYGFYRARTAHLHPRTIKPRHFVPATLVVGVPALILVRPRWGAVAAAGYLASALALGGLSPPAGSGRAERIRAAIVVPLVHSVWGAGFVAGLVAHAGAKPEPGLALQGSRSE